MRPRHFLLCMLVVLAAAPAGASASGWSGLGGSPARSGHDALDPGAGTPVAFAWERVAAPAGEPVHSGPVVSWGAPGGSRVGYGTAAGSFFVQRFGDGAPVGSSGGVPLDGGTDDTNTFGNANGKVSAVTVSGALDPGQIYVLHNDGDQNGTDDIALAQIDASTGALIQDQALSGTNGFDVQSSPVITDPDADGTSHLLFVANGPGGVRRLYRIDISNALSTLASWVTPTFVGVNNTNPTASPALVWLQNAAGVPTEYVALGTSGGFTVLETYSVANLAQGPVAPGAGLGQTPATPLTGDGLLPGSPKSGFATTPYIYAAENSLQDTVVNKIEQSGSSQSLTVTPSPTTFDGSPAPAMAVSRRVGTNETEGVIALTTSSNLYLVESGNLTEKARFVDPGPITAPGQAFARTTAALSDTYAFVSRDNGDQLVLNTGDAQPVGASEFTESLNNSTTSESYGGPALAAGRVVFTSNRGTFAYSTIDGTPPRVALISPPEPVSGNVTLQAQAYDARGVSAVDFRIDGTSAGTAFAPEPGSLPSHALPGALFSLPVDTRGLANGDHVVEAVAADGRGLTTTSKATLRVANSVNPADTEPPDTAIEAGPGRRTSDTTPRFRFSSSERPEVFECSLDGSRFRPCPDRHVLALVAGRHRLRVRAVDAAGNVDPTPSIRSFTVLAPGPVEVAALRPLELNRRGQVAVPVTCHSRRRCRGVLVLAAFVPRAKAGSLRAAPARKGRKLRVGKRRFSVGARTRRKVLVRVSTTGRRLLRQNGRLKALATVNLNTPAGVQRSSWPLTLTARDD